MMLIDHACGLYRCNMISYSTEFAINDSYMREKVNYNLSKPNKVLRFVSCFLERTN